MIRCTVFLAALLLLTPWVAAQSRDERPATLFNWHGTPAEPLGELEPIATDRPDFTETSSTVGLGVVQIETGYTFTEDDDLRSHSWGEPLLRVGILANWLEFRSAVFPTTQIFDNGPVRQSDSGAEDLYLGFKLALMPQDGPLPEIAITPQMTVPTGSAAFTDNRVLPGANLLYGWDLNDQLSAGGSTQFNSSVDGTDNRYTEWAQSLTAGYSISEQVGSYVEWYALFPHGAANVDPEHYFNGGLTYRLTDDVQFDIRAGLGLNDAAEDFFVGTGLSVRFK